MTEKFLLKAVLFDYDGVLVDSMSYHMQAWQTVFRDVNLEIKSEEVYLTEGSRSIELARKIFSEHHLPITEEELIKFVDKKQQVYQQITKAKLTDGAEALIRKFKEDGLQVGLVTGSTRFNVNATLPPHILSQFDIIITGDETQNGKPHPEGYINAARALGVKPAACLVIENAPFGIQAAKNAGMKVAALTVTLDRGQLEGADYYAASLHDLEKNWNTIFKPQRS
jgi:beta-phosphoglucomutase